MKGLGLKLRGEGWRSRFWHHQTSVDPRACEGGAEERGWGPNQSRDGSWRSAENKVKRWYCQTTARNTRRPQPREEDFPGRKVSSFKCHGQIKMRQEQRPWTCLSEVTVKWKSHFIKWWGQSPTARDSRVGEGQGEEAVGVNRQGMTPSQGKHPRRLPMGGYCIKCQCRRHRTDVSSPRQEKLDCRNRMAEGPIQEGLKQLKHKTLS